MSLLYTEQPENATENPSWEMLFETRPYCVIRRVGTDMTRLMVIFVNAPPTGF